MLTSLILTAFLASMPITTSAAITANSAPTQQAGKQQDAAKQSTSKKAVRPAGMWYGIEDARPKAKGALRLACYNAENLFDRIDDPTQSGEYDDLKEATTEVRLKAIAAVIRRLDADVLCLEEIESKECLTWFRDTYLKGMGYDYLASEDVSYYRGVEQSVLSRVPITKVTVFKGEDAVIEDMKARQTPELAKALGAEWGKPTSAESGNGKPKVFQRSPLKVDLKTKDGYELTVYCVHYKAGNFDHQRELEALQTEAFIKDGLKANPDANIAVLGDFNGTPNDMNVRVLRSSDAGLVSAYDWRFDKKPASPDVFTTHASGRSIDFIVMTPGLAADCIDGSYFVLGAMHAASDWDYKKAAEIPPPDGYASDHYPVVIDIAVKNDKPASDFKSPARSNATAATPATSKDSATTTSDTKSNDSASDKSIDSENGLRALTLRTAPAADIATATALHAAGWSYVMPMPKSKTASWENTNAKSTFWIGHWKHAPSGKTSQTAPADGNDIVGGESALDEKGKVRWKDGGAPAAPSFVEWLCSSEGGIEPK